MKTKPSLIWILLLASFHSLIPDGLGQNTLRLPPVLTGPVFNLDMQNGMTPLLPGTRTATSGYNRRILGPILLMNQGDVVTLNVTNNLGAGIDTTTHWHGMHVTPEDDGGPHSVIAAGATWSPSFQVLDSASTMWYHPHLHLNTHIQVNSGLSSMILISDAIEDASGLPMTLNVDEFPLILQDKTFDASNQFQVVGMGDVPMVNGTLDPFLEVPAQFVRFRVLNGSNQRGYHLGLSDNRAFFVVGTDGGLLEAPVPVTRATILPAERLDIVIDFTTQSGSTFQLMSYASELTNRIPGAAPGPGGGGNPLNGIDYDLLELRVVVPTPAPVTSLPASIWTIDRPLEAEATVFRTIQFTGGGGGTPFSLDNQAFNLTRMDQVVLKDSVEIWSLENLTNDVHPFHIHDIQFFILDRDTGGGPAPPPAHQAGKKDVVHVLGGETVRFITKFITHSDTETPYMYHCHILPHEDAGMMGQFLVVDPTADLVTQSLAGSDLTLRWSKNLGPGVFKLQTTTDLGSFSDVLDPPALVDDKNQLIWNITDDARFFRLTPDN